MDLLFEWHGTQVVLTFFRSLSLDHYHTPVDYDSALGKDVFARIYIESETQQTARLVEHIIMQINYKLGPLINNIGANTTVCYQPIDVGKSFKIIR